MLGPMYYPYSLVLIVILFNEMTRSSPAFEINNLMIIPHKLVHYLQAHRGSNLISAWGRTP